MKQLKNERGLTLVELLAVIVILAIIAAIAAVAIGNVIQNSKDKAILSDAVAIVEGAKIAHMDNACGDEASNTVTCSEDQLKPFVEGVDLNKEGLTATVTITTNAGTEATTGDGSKTYEITYSEFANIKNRDKYGMPTDNKVEYQQLLKTLNGEGPATTTD